MYKKILVKAPAKVNLTLDVKYKRQDGYHELETVMHQVDLFDRLFLEVGGDQSIVINSNSQEIPHDYDNLVYKAAQTIMEKYGFKAGVNVFIEKNIPVEAGLAGGSSDAAAALYGINELFSLGASMEELLEMGATLGSDIPFCLYGATALARGRGELLEAMPQGPELILVLVKPPFQVSTAEVYRSLDLDQINLHPNNLQFLGAWAECNLNAIAANMVNVLESVTINKYPELERIKKELVGMGALNAVMSGSGPTIMGLFADRELANSAMTIMKEQYKHTYLVSSYVRSDY